MKKKSIALITTAAVGVSSLAGCSLIKNEKEKFVGAVENLYNATGTGVVKVGLNLEGKDVPAHVTNTIKGSYVEFRTVVDTKKNEEVGIDVHVPLEMEDGTKLNLDVELLMYVDREQKALYFDVTKLYKSLEGVYAGLEKVPAEFLGESSEAGKAEALEFIKAQVVGTLSGLGVNVEDNKDDVVKIDLLKLTGMTEKELNEFLKDEEKGLEKTATLYSVVIKTFAENLKDEKFKDNKLALTLAEIIDGVAYTLENVKADGEVITEDIKESLKLYATELKTNKEQLIEGAGVENFNFKVDYKIKKEKFKELGLTLDVETEGLKGTLKVENKYDEKAKFNFNKELKGVEVVDLTDLVIENLGEEFGEGIGELLVTGDSVEIGAAGAGTAALFYPYFKKLVQPSDGIELEKGLGEF